MPRGATTAKEMVRALAEALGAELDVTRGLGVDLEAVAPRGTVWALTGTHSVVSSTQLEETDQDWEALLRDMEGGVEPCTDPHCEWCGGEESGDGQRV